MNELVGIITKDNYLSDDLIKDVLCIVGGYNSLRLGEAGCQFSLKDAVNISNLHKVRSMKVDVNIVSKINQEKQLLIADMDGTLINEECIDELAKFTGFSDEVFRFNYIRFHPVNHACLSRNLYMGTLVNHSIFYPG